MEIEPIEFGEGIYDYQRHAVEAALVKRRGVLKIVTGGGKTECAVALSKTLQHPTMFITHRVNLLYQTAERFALRWPELKEYNMIGIIGDSQYHPNFITFSTVQTLDSYLKKSMSKRGVMADLQKYRVLIIDEAHRSGAKQFQTVGKAMVNADYRIGLTWPPRKGLNLKLILMLVRLNGSRASTLTAPGSESSKQKPNMTMSRNSIYFCQLQQ